MKISYLTTLLFVLFSSSFSFAHTIIAASPETTYMSGIEVDIIQKTASQDYEVVIHGSTIANITVIDKSNNIVASSEVLTNHSKQIRWNFSTQGLPNGVYTICVTSELPNQTVYHSITINK